MLTRIDHVGIAVQDLDAAVEHYRPQMEAYRRALCALTGLNAGQIACRLAFLASGEVREV
jgi:hypothetical protein